MGAARRRAHGPAADARHLHCERRNRHSRSARGGRGEQRNQHGALAGARRAGAQRPRRRRRDEPALGAGHVELWRSRPRRRHPRIARDADPCRRQGARRRRARQKPFDHHRYAARKTRFAAPGRRGAAPGGGDGRHRDGAQPRVAHSPTRQERRARSEWRNADLRAGQALSRTRDRRLGEQHRRHGEEPAGTRQLRAQSGPPHQPRVQDANRRGEGRRRAAERTVADHDRGRGTALRAQRVRRHRPP